LGGIFTGDGFLVGGGGGGGAACLGSMTSFGVDVCTSFASLGLGRAFLACGTGVSMYWSKSGPARSEVKWSHAAWEGGNGLKDIRLVS
jgi:hypothetical protein